jgi:hypothetical protein
MRTFTKNSCVPSGNDYVTFNLIAHPLQSIPGGGGAFVYYDNLVDCQISKHVNLARAETVLTLPNNVCTYGGFIGFARIISCDDSISTQVFSARWHRFLVNPFLPFMPNPVPIWIQFHIRQYVFQTAELLRVIICSRSLESSLLSVSCLFNTTGKVTKIL